MTDIDTVRLLIADTSTDPTKQLLTDDQVQAFLDLEGGAVKLAAATALDAIATSEVLVLKVITGNGLTTNGAAVAAALQKQAQSLRDQYDRSDDGGYFEIIPFCDDTDVCCDATG